MGDTPVKRKVKSIGELSRKDQDAERGRLWLEWLDPFLGSLRRYVRSKVHVPVFEASLKEKSGSVDVVLSFRLGIGNEKGDLLKVSGYVERWMVGLTGQDRIKCQTVESGESISFVYPVNVALPCPVLELEDEMNKWLEVNEVFGSSIPHYRAMFKEAYRIQRDYRGKVLAIWMDIFHYKTVHLYYQDPDIEARFKEIVEIVQKHIKPKG